MDCGYIVHVTIASARQVLLAGVPGDFTWGFSRVCAPPPGWPVSFELKIFDRELKWINKVGGKGHSYYPNPGFIQAFHTRC